MNSKPLPYDLNVEKNVLGNVLMLHDSLHLINLEVVDFYYKRHRVIFQAAVDQDRRSEPYDIVSIVSRLKGTGKIDEAGCEAYISDLTNIIPRRKQLQHYAKVLQKYSWRRQVITVAEEAREMCLSPVDDFSELQAQIEHKMLTILNTQNREKNTIFSTRDSASKALEIIEQRARMPDKATGLSTGFYKLDLITNGLQPSDLIILAARPSMGKTTLAMNILQQAAISWDVPVLFFSLEMSNPLLMDRQLSALSEVPLFRIRNGNVRENDWPKLSRAAGILTESIIFIDDAGALRITEIRSRARRLKVEHDVGLIVVDYLQLIKSPKRNGTREQEISEISQNLKAMAKELNVPVLALSQLNRSLENRTDKRPQLSDLRESGAIEQDADLILFIYRDEFYNPNTQEKGLAELIVGKHRNGPTGTIKLSFRGEISKFIDM